MDTISIILLILISVLLLWIIIIFNSLISLKNNAKKAFSGIDVQLKRRADLIPNLIETVKAYAKHEKVLFENLTKARTSIFSASSNRDLSEMAKQDNILSSNLKTVFAVAENYPNLKANENFLKLQEQLSETEDQISASRRIYNQNTTDFNIKIESFPSNLIAKLFSFQKMDLFEISNQEKEVINVNL